MFTPVKDSTEYLFKIANPTDLQGPVTFEFTPARDVENVKVDEDPESAGVHEVIGENKYLMQGMAKDGFIWIPYFHRTASVILMANWIDSTA